MEQLRIPANIEQLGAVMEFVDEVLERGDCPLEIRTLVDVAVEEIFVNIASYAYTSDEGVAELNAGFEGEPRRVVITFKDSGVPYDPLENPDPDISLSAEERSVGGLGIFLVKQIMDKVGYRYENGQNILTLEKRLSV